MLSVGLRAVAAPCGGVTGEPARCARYLKRKVADARNAAEMVWRKGNDTCARRISEEEFLRLKAVVRSAALPSHRRSWRVVPKVRQNGALTLM